MHQLLYDHMKWHFHIVNISRSVETAEDNSTFAVVSGISFLLGKNNVSNITQELWEVNEKYKTAKIANVRQESGEYLTFLTLAGEYTALDLLILTVDIIKLYFTLFYKSQIKSCSRSEIIIFLFNCRSLPTKQKKVVAVKSVSYIYQDQNDFLVLRKNVNSSTPWSETLKVKVAIDCGNVKGCEKLKKRIKQDEWITYVLISSILHLIHKFVYNLNSYSLFVFHSLSTEKQDTDAIPTTPKAKVKTYIFNQHTWKHFSP